MIIVLRFIKMICMGVLMIIKNVIGWYLGYGTCPNCNNTFWWTRYVNIPYKRWAHGWFGLILCHTCVENNCSLNTSVIRKNLTKAQWPDDKIQLAIQAVEGTLGH